MLQSKNSFNFEIIEINKITKLFINFKLFNKVWIQKISKWWWKKFIKSVFKYFAAQFGAGKREERSFFFIFW